MSRAPTVHQAIAVLAAVSIFPAARIEDFPLQATFVVIGVALWRITRGAAGEALAGVQVRVTLRAAAALSTFVLLAVMTRGALNPLAGLLLLLAMIQVLCLIESQAPFVQFLVLLLATAQVTGAAFVCEDAVGLLLTLLTLAALLGAALLFERRLAAMRVGSTGASVRKVRIGDPGAVPSQALARSFAALLILGVLGGGVLAVALPWLWTLELDARGVAAADGDREEASAEIQYVTGPDLSTKGIRLGDVGRIKVDLTPYFEVVQPETRPPMLREDTFEVYRRREGWVHRKKEEVPAPEKLVTHPADDGWVSTGREDDDVRGFSSRIWLLRGPMPRLWLERDVVRMRFVRDGEPLAATVFHHYNEQMDIRPPLRTHDYVELRAVPPVYNDRQLAAARSDGSVSPSPGYVELPASCFPLVAEAERVVGDEGGAWRRALRLLAWLRSDPFTYTLEVPPVDSDTPIVDFVTRTRSGHCEYFASALALMLRSLGHPARVARGFRGGDWMEQRGSWIVRGSHYHLWTEIYLDPYGWVPLDPTPPDDEAVDARTRTAEAGSSEDDQASSAGWLASLLGLSAAECQAVYAWIDEQFARWIGRPLAFLFGPRGLYMGWGLLALGFVWLTRRRANRAWEKEHGVRARRAAGAPYVEVLKLLSAVGLRRRRTWTPREFLREVRTWMPEAQADLAWLTVAHERMRYGARPLASDLEPEARERVSRVGEVAKQRKRRGRRS